jgi:hypothetical protein
MPSAAAENEREASVSSSAPPESIGLFAGPLLLFIGLVLAVLFVAFRYVARRPRRPSARTPRPRHLVTRIVCGTLGAGILAAVAVGTWRDVRQIYFDEEARALRLRVPTQEAPGPVLKRGEEIRLDSARLLVHLLVGEQTGAGFRPLHADETEVRWPADRGRNFNKAFRVGDSRCALQFQLGDVGLRGAPTGRGSELALSGRIRVHIRRWDFSSSLGGSFGGNGAQLLSEMRAETEGPHPLSIVHSLRRTMFVYSLVTRVAEDDPLKAVSLEEFAQSHEAEWPQEAVRSHGDWVNRPEFDDIPMRGLALAGFIGTSSLLLLAASILLAQLFARRNLAFAGVLAGVVLYVAVLDRAALGMHLDHLADRRAPAATRLLACRYAAETFFYRAASRRALESIVQDASAPDALRETARRLAIDLSSRNAGHHP